MTSARKTCRKRRFRNEFEAAKWLRAMRRHVKKGDVIIAVPRRIYYHPACKGFHATSRMREGDVELAENNNPERTMNDCR